MESKDKMIKSIEAIKKYLGMQDIDILDEFPGWIVAVETMHDDDGDYDELAFIQPRVYTDDFPEEDVFNRAEFERVAFSWLAENGEQLPCMPMRGDVISMRFFGEDRGMVRHLRGASTSRGSL